MPPTQRPPPPKNKGKDIVKEGQSKQTEKVNLKKQEKLVMSLQNDLNSLKELMGSTSLDGSEERSSAPKSQRPPKS